MNWIEVTPAYGRDYNNKKLAAADWNADLDFRDTVSGSYINKTGAKAAGLKVIIRYKKLQSVMEAPMK